MSLQQAVQPRPSSNGFGRREVERDSGNRLDTRLPPGRANPGILSHGGSLNRNKIGGYENPSRDRLIYFTTCLVGHLVEVQVKNGSVYSGIFHATNADNDFGIILKMARLTKDGSLKGQKVASDSVGKGLSKTMIIPAKDLVQVKAKDVAVTGRELINDVEHEKHQDIMLDSYISTSSIVEVERELERWAPEEDDPECPELENIFDGTWNRHWDQFETNAALFGVRSTFDEELYTTKLERGPQTRELEREALRIAKEIEGEEALNEDFNIDEETRFASVFRGVNDNACDKSEVILLDSHNAETFGGSSGSFSTRPFSEACKSKANDGTHASSSFSSADEAQLTEPNAGRELYQLTSSDYARRLDEESRMTESHFREQHSQKIGGKEHLERKAFVDVSEEAQMSKFGDKQSSSNSKEVNFDKGGLSSSATAYAPPSCLSSKDQVQADSSSEASDHLGSSKARTGPQLGNLRGQPGSSASSTSDRAVPSLILSGPGLSPSSSMGSLSSEKSTLNPYAKEFKLNPNAKSFTPSQAPLRPSSPVSDVSYYFPANASTVSHIHGVPIGLGIGPSFGGPQPAVYNPMATPMQPSQSFIHPNSPLYGQQQMILGHPRQVLYVPSYPPDTPYKGREY